jgi:uncharacterized membrane protein
MLTNTAYADPGALFGTGLPKVCKPRLERSLYGDIAVVLFLLAQCFDGVFTYVGVASYGLAIEANPLLGALMASFGHGTALAAAKVVAAGLGIGLHLKQVHGAVALLTAFYTVVAIFPWVMILFFEGVAI